MQTHQRTGSGGFEERVAAASRATIAAATEVQAVIAGALNAMGDAWTAATNEANDRDAQRAAILAVARDYPREAFQVLVDIPRWPPANTSPMARLLSGVVVQSPQGGWAVGGQVLNRLSGDLREAQQAAAQASRRMFSGRYRSEAQIAAESVLGIVRALKARADRLSKEREEALKRRETEADSMRASADERLKLAMASLSDSDANAAAPAEHECLEQPFVAFVDANRRSFRRVSRDVEAASR
jgi:hypothetical protein